MSWHTLRDRAFSMPKSKSSSLLLTTAGFVLPALASRASRDLSRAGYQFLTKSPAPRNPASPEVRWSEALLWAAAAGAIGGLARLTARRLLAETDIPTEGDDMDEALIELQEN